MEVLAEELQNTTHIMQWIRRGAAVCLLSSRTTQEMAELLASDINQFDLSNQIVVGRPGSSSKLREIIRQDLGVLNINSIPQDAAKQKVLMDFLADITMAAEEMAQDLGVKGLGSIPYILILDASSFPNDVINFVLPRLALDSCWQIFWIQGKLVFPYQTMISSGL